MNRTRQGQQKDNGTTPLGQGAAITRVVSEFGIRPPPLLLPVEFAQGVVTARHNTADGRETTRLTWLHKRYILWATSEGFSPQDIASRIGCSRRTVARLLKSLLKDTILLYHSGFLVRIEAGRTGKSIRYFCRFCGATYREPRRANDHAFYHVFPDGGGLLRRPEQ